MACHQNSLGITLTDLVKQVPSGGKLEEHIDTRHVVVLILGFDDDSTDEFEHVAMFQRSVDLHFFVYRFAILVRGFICDVDQFACRHSMVFNVYGSEHPGVCVNLMSKGNKSVLGTALPREATPTDLLNELVTWCSPSRYSTWKIVNCSTHQRLLGTS